MIYKKHFLLLVFLLLLIMLTVFVIKYVKTNNTEIDTTYIDTVEYKQKIENINKLKYTIDSLTNKNKYDKAKIENLDDSSTIELFIKLVEGE